MPVDGRALHVEMPVERNTGVLAAQKPAKRTLTDLERFPTQVDTIQLQEVEGAKRHGMVLTPVAKQIEYGEAVGVACDGLAIDDA